jgi:Flp pilus assembly protein TadG
MRSTKRWLGDERGQAMTEFILVLPIFVLMLFCMIELGRIFNVYIAMTAAAREGGRVAAINGCTGDVTTKTREATGFSDSSSVTVDCGAPSGNTCSGSVTSGNSVCVKASYPVDIITPIVRQFFPDNVITVTGKTTMRRE